MLDDADLETRRHALLTVNALLRGPPVPGLLEQVVPVVLPAMYRQMAQDPSLVRTVGCICLSFVCRHQMPA